MFWGKRFPFLDRAIEEDLWVKSFLFPFLELPCFLTMSWWPHCVWTEQYSNCSALASNEYPDSVDYFSIFHFALPFLLIQQCSVNRLDYTLMQTYGPLLRQKGRLCLGNDICSPVFSWKHKSLTFLSRLFFILKPW